MQTQLPIKLYRSIVSGHANRAGLLFRGDLLQLSGRAEVLWDGPEVERFQGAQRMLRFSTERFILRPRALSFRWSLCEASPHLEATGVWT